MTTVFIAPELKTSADVVADNIRRACASRQMNRSDLARAMGMDVASAGYRWRGQREWKLSELDNVARVLGISVTDLLTRHDRDGLPRLDSNQQPSD